MGGLFGKQKAVELPPVPLAPPIPTVDTEEIETQARKKRPIGRRATFLTGDLIPETTKKRTLG